MLQVRVLSGKMAGNLQVVRRFPFRIGRAPGNELSLDDSGVWDTHLTVQFEKSEGFLLQVSPEAFAAINAEPKQTARLRNGDIISFGSAKIQFWLAPPLQRSLRPRELAVWALIAAVTLFQVILIYRLIR